MKSKERLLWISIIVVLVVVSLIHSYSPYTPTTVTQSLTYTVTYTATPNGGSLNFTYLGELSNLSYAQNMTIIVDGYPAYIRYFPIGGGYVGLLESTPAIMVLVVATYAHPPPCCSSPPSYSMRYVLTSMSSSDFYNLSQFPQGYTFIGWGPLTLNFYILN